MYCDGRILASTCIQHTTEVIAHSAEIAIIETKQNQNKKYQINIITQWNGNGQLVGSINIR